jgi:uncharacterized protein
MKLPYAHSLIKSIVAHVMLACTFSLNALGQESGYDAALAEKLGADERGMKKYVMAFLYRGERVAEYTPEQRAEIQKGHMGNITKLAESGKLIMAGPFFGNEDLRGIFVFDVSTMDEAASLTAQDPAVAAGVLKMDLREWYGPAALMMITDLHAKLTKPAN